MLGSHDLIIMMKPAKYWCCYYSIIWFDISGPQPAALSEMPYITSRAMGFIDEALESNPDQPLGCTCQLCQPALALHRA